MSGWAAAFVKAREVSLAFNYSAVDVGIQITIHFLLPELLINVSIYLSVFIIWLGGARGRDGVSGRAASAQAAGG